MFAHKPKPGPYRARQQTTKEIRLPTASMGAVIGRGGTTIKSLMQESGARIQIHTPDTHEGVSHAEPNLLAWTFSALQPRRWTR